jgi:hypothetical protein
MSQATIERFYTAFERLDSATMQACYAEGALFEDEVFSLVGPLQIGGMWRMLCDATKDKGRAHWKLVASNVTDSTAHWEAHYKFTATGRMVHNRIDAAFQFNGRGQITWHRDRFDFWRWSRQALGTPGLLLGWTPWFRNQVRHKAARNLQRFIDRG